MGTPAVSATFTVHNAGNDSHHHTEEHVLLCRGQPTLAVHPYLGHKVGAEAYTKSPICAMLQSCVRHTPIQCHVAGRPVAHVWA